MSFNGSIRGSSAQTAEDNYYGEGMDSAYTSDLRGSSIQHEVSEFLYNLLEQIVITSQDDVQDRQRSRDLFRLYNSYFYFSERTYATSRWPTVDEVSRHLKIDNDLEGWQIPVSLHTISQDM